MNTGNVDFTLSKVNVNCTLNKFFVKHGHYKIFLWCISSTTSKTPTFSNPILKLP